ncbi:MAG: site-2 protease family protein [Anaerolineae bacterium]
MFNLPTLSVLISRAIVLIVAFPAHEGAHAIVANWLGDPTPRRAGRISWNPFRQLDIVGAVLFLYAGIGWAYTPVDPSRLGRRGMAIVSVAGPVANFLVALLFALPARYVIANESLSQLFGYQQIFPSLGQIMWAMVLYNVILGVFNLIPIPPLDGFSILLGIVPYSWYIMLSRLQPYAVIIILGVVFLLPMVGINPIGQLINNVALPIAAALAGL